MLSRMQSDILTIRKELFGSERPPFGSLHAAIGWLRREGARRGGGVAAVDAAWRRASRACWRLGELVGLECIPSVRGVDYLACRRHPGVPQGGEHSVEVTVRLVNSATLTRLKRFAAPAAEGTGFSEGDLVAYVLVGDLVEPAFSAWRATIQTMTATLPSGTTLERRRMSIDLHVRDVPWSELRTMYRQLGPVMKINLPPHLFTQKELRLRRAVKAMGGRPLGRGAGAVWREIALRSGYTNAQAARVAHDRILTKEDAYSQHADREGRV